MKSRLALAVLGIVPLCGCEAMQPKNNAPQSSVNNLRGAQIFGGRGKLLSPEEAKKARDGSAIDPTVVEERDDIVSVEQFWNPMPWLMDSGGRATGFRVPVYFVSGKTEFGAFVPGTILAWLYLVDRDAPPGSEGRQPLYVWELPRSDAMGFRVRKKVQMGYPYYFILKWPEQFNVSGETIEVQFGYERMDKRIVLGTPQRFKVPVPPGTPRRRPPVEAPPPAAARTFTPEELAALRRQVAKESAPPRASAEDDRAGAVRPNRPAPPPASQPSD